jgi:ubiquinone/menaquinone biosynthesis C-methylase UbiE
MVERGSFTIEAGEYLASVVGLAALRDLFVDVEQVRQRFTELRRLTADGERSPFRFPVTFVEHDVDDGYTRWSETYDRPATNPAILGEEELVLPLLERAPRGDALDVACGTGRHVGNLLELGYSVAGVDATEAMLEIARVKYPDATLERADWDQLPFGDASFDVVTCALALCHAVDVRGPIMEMARMLRPGGWLVLSDIHPNSTRLGGAAAFPGDDYGEVPYVRNHVHDLSEYFAAFGECGLVVLELHEGRMSDEYVALMPSYAAFPEATVRAFRDMPSIVAWVATKR